MIVVLTTPSHDYTHRVLEGNGRFELRRMTYERVLTRRRLPRATYVFTDLDRLNFWELQLAARLYAWLQRAGLEVLNDPARVRQRFGLLRTLKENGFNRFDAWRIEDPRRPAPQDYPVFLRTEAAHRGNLTELLETPDALEAAVEQALAKGIPRRDLIAIQYCAQPLRPGLFRKLAAFRVGDRMVTSLAVHESRWTAKYGELGIASPEDYVDEHASIRDNRYGELLRPAFEAAGIEYGRVDFALVDGRPQVYEINTNPNLKRLTSHPVPLRLEAARQFDAALVEAFAALDTREGGPPVLCDEEALGQQRRHDRWLWKTRWVP
jgi:hypothetical protein